jgi:arginyl-tRNA synthetase
MNLNGQNGLTDSLTQHLSELAGIEKQELSSLIEFELGSEKADLTLKIFRLLKLNKIDEAQVIGSFGVSFADAFEKVEVVKGYINFTFKPEYLFKLAFEDDGKIAAAEKQSYMIEYLSPNTNKPLHLGHVRNGSIGMALANLAKANGQEVKLVQIINDRGIAICKSLLAWKKFGNGATPESVGMKGDHFVGEYYVKFAQEAEKNSELEAQAQELLQKWEAGDEQTVSDWKLMNSWFMAGFKQSCADFGFASDKDYFESEVYKSGKQVVEDGLAKGVFRKNEKGAVVIDLPEEEFGLNEDSSKKVMTVLREDGTSLYVTQDIALAVKRFSEEKIDRSWYVVGSEQTYYFKALFYIIDKLGLLPREKLLHRSYGMIYLPQGKMKSREGTVVDADDLFSEVTEVVHKQMEESERSDKDGVDIRAIALAAVKFEFLKVDPNREIHYDPLQSIDIHGFTGPFNLYAYTRLHKILDKAGSEGSPSAQVEASAFNEREIASLKSLVIRVLGYQKAVREAFESADPSKIAKYVFDLSGAVNSFYEAVPVLAEENAQKKDLLLAIVKLARDRISEALGLLGIKTVEKM